MYDRNGYASQYHEQANPRRGYAAPPYPPFARGPPGHLAQYQHWLPLPPPSEIPYRAPPYPPMQQAPPGLPHFSYWRHLPALPAQQLLHLPPQGPMSMHQPYSFTHPGPSYPPSMSGSNANYVSQSLQPVPPPPGVSPSHSFPPPSRQSLHRIPRPPPRRFQHVSAAHVRDTHPPSLPLPLPPAPAPPLPAPGISVVNSKAPSGDNRIGTDILDASIDPVQSTKDMPQGCSSDVEVDDTKSEVSVGNGEAQGELLSPPPKPAEEEVIQNIQMMCQFIAKVGPDFEKFVRTKEVGNPQFSFLLGGEPGSAAAIAHEYFQWVKKNCCLEVRTKLG